MSPTPVQQVEHDLRAGKAAWMSPHTARRWWLAPWAHYTADPDSALRQECAGDFAQAWARLIRLQLRFAELHAAWAAAGIDVTVFKGFAVAHLAYPHPALRHFNDIDVYVKPADASRALAALPQGWRILPNLFLHTPHGSTALRSPCNELEVDLHRSFFKPHRVTSPRHEWITQQLLARRITIDCGPFEIRSLASADLALIGLAVNRGYGRDGWRPKTHDYLDLLYLRQQLGLSGNTIFARAKQLGLRATWRAYARACDPGRRRLQLEPLHQSFWHSAWNDLMSLAERRELPNVMLRLLRAPPALRDALIVTPTLLALIGPARSGASTETLLNLTHLPLPSRRQRVNVLRGVHWGLRLLRPLIARQGLSTQVLGSIAMHRLLHSQGLTTEWIYGTSHHEERAAEDYAWLELDGFPLRIWPDEAKRSVYAERLRIARPPRDCVTTKLRSHPEAYPLRTRS